MNINPAGLSIIKNWEGCVLDAYLCPAKVLTIGYGHTGPDVTKGLRITKAQAEALLASDVVRFEYGVTHLAKNPTEDQFSALVSLAFNIGLDAFARSSLLKAHNAGDYATAKAKFADWVYAGGKPQKGLIARRKDEARLYGS